ncbi:hypothetical protein QZH41_011160, partial [Actinostola sp. cb2023]
GVVKDPCNCCDVCAKQVGQKCGGPWNLAGRCDKGLSCVVRKDGIIIQDRTTCATLSCPNYHTCAVSDQQAMCQCPRHCKKTGLKVCGLTNGIEYDNECELRKYECKKNEKISFKHGPCKRCVMDSKRYKFGEQVRSGLCELCSCAHGVWKCKNTFCLNQNTKTHRIPSFAPEGAPCDVNGGVVRCSPGTECRARGHTLGGMCIRTAGNMFVFLIFDVSSVSLNGPISFYA